MIFFFKTPQKSVIATETTRPLTQEETKELCWLYGNAELLEAEKLEGYYVGPRREMVTLGQQMLLRSLRIWGSTAFLV